MSAIQDNKGVREEKTTGLHIILMIVIPTVCALAGSIGLIGGAAVTFKADRVAEKITQEVMVERGAISLPAQKIIQEGRIDVTIQRKILFLFLWSTELIEDVVDISYGTSSSDIRDSRGRLSSSSSSSHVTLKSRLGREWRSPSASGSFGSNPKDVAAGLRTFLNGTESTISFWWMPWLENVVGIPFSLLTLLMAWSYLKMAFKKIFPK